MPPDADDNDSRRGRARAGKIGKGAATAALIALFGFVPATLFIQNITDSSGVQSLTDPAGLGTPGSNSTYADATPIYSAQGSEVCIARAAARIAHSDDQRS